MQPPKSPCINVCVLDESDICRGCVRRRTEIALWTSMSPRDQWRVIEAAQGRRDFVEAGFRREGTAVDVVDRIRQQLSENPVVLYMKGTPDFPQCGFSAQAVAALRSCGARFAHVNIFEDPELREALKRHSNWPTYPQLYVNGELIGGSDITLEMYRSGELQKLLESAGATAANES
jgi:monothiol glutaredoxin